MLLNLDSKSYICIFDVTDKDKEQKLKKELIKQIGNNEYKKNMEIICICFTKKNFKNF